MPAAHALVPTDRAHRYLDQLCSHGAKLAGATGHTPHRDHAGPSDIRHVEHSATEGVIDFGFGRCTVRATVDHLSLLVEAGDPARLRHIQDGIAGRLRMIGRRDSLTVHWTDPPEILARLVGPDGRADPYPLYATLHEFGPVADAGGGLYLVCGYTAVNQILRDPGFGLPDPADPDPDHDGTGALRSLGQSILRTNPPAHGRMRSLISQVFTPRRVAALRPAIETAVDRLLDSLTAAASGGRPVDFMDRFAFPLPVAVICELLGVPDDQRDRFRPLAADLTEALELTTGSPFSAAADSAARELSAYFTSLVAQRRADPRDDLIGALVTVRDADDGRLSERELLANLITLLVAGFETTTSLLGNGLAILLERPDIAAALRERTIAVPDFVEEVLRYEAPVQATTRIAQAAGLTAGGASVPEGSQLILLIGAANRDPARYPDPDSFDPSRTDIKPLSFGSGPHICIGNGLARLEAEVAFSRLLTGGPQLSAAPEPRRVRRDRLVLRGYETLPVAVTVAQAGSPQVDKQNA